MVHGSLPERAFCQQNVACSWARACDNSKKTTNTRHRVASVSQELSKEVAKPRWIAAAIAPAAVCHSGSPCLMALNVLSGWQLLFPNILKRSLAVDPKIFPLLLSPYDPV